jgi:hypothetical protein
MTGQMTVLVVLGLIAAATVLAHFAVEWFQRRFLVVSGLEFIVLGALLGPSVAPQIRALEDLTSLAPVIGFAAGWVGLLYGMELDFRKRGIMSDRSTRLAVVDVAFTVVPITWVAWFALTRGWWMDPVGNQEASVAALALGCAGAAGSSASVDLLRRRFAGLETDLLPMLRGAARMGDLLAIVGFGLLFCLFHEGETATESPPDALDWFVLTLVLGVALGWLFRVFLGHTEDDNHRFLALVGILIFASGAAFFLNLSALLVNLLLGVVIVNSKQGQGISQVLERTHGPVRIVLLVFAGAMWAPVSVAPALALAAGYIGLRTVAKGVGGMVATWGTPIRGDIVRGMMAQGDVAIAMAISLKLVYAGPAIDLAYTAILVAVVVHEAVAPRLLKGLMIDAGELRSETDGQAEGGAI